MSCGAPKRMATSTKQTQSLLILPEPKTCTASGTFMKKLAATAISTIIYTRNLFDEADFCKKSFEGIDIKIVKGGSRNSDGARCLSNWLEGAFHAMDLKYLKALTFEIKDATERLLETYSFHFTYENDQASCTLNSDSDGKSVSKPMEVSGETRDAVRSLLRGICVMTSAMPQLPQKCTTTVKITYYEEVTPEDYQPPGFIAFHGEGAGLEFSGATQKWNCGKVKTRFHSLTVRTRQLKTSGELSEEDGPQTVKCLCEMTDNIGSMLKCATCGTCQHAACYKVFTDDDASQKSHECRKCGGDGPSKDYDSTECIFRRVLATCAKSKTVSIVKLMKGLNLAADSTQLQMRRLQREGALLKSTQPFTMDKPDFLYNVNRDNIIQVLKPKYFK